MEAMELRRRPGQPVRPVAVTNWSPEFSADIEARLDAFLLGDRAASTVRSYACQQRQYALFCQMLSVPDARRFEPRTIAQWVMGRADHGYKLSTVELGVHAIGALCMHSFWRSTEIRQAISAAARLRSSAVVRKLPILRSLLAGMVSAGDGAWRARRDACFWVLGWHGVFRGSELVAMRWEDVVVHAEGLVMLVRRSKTDQAGAGHFVFLHAANQRELCPVRCLNALAESTPLLSGPIFTGQPGGLRSARLPCWLVCTACWRTWAGRRISTVYTRSAVEVLPRRRKGWCPSA